tara:strand:+ start:473 stop:601 length:129 start_codon:yes stop_codon:yes gene_type:complete
MADVTELTDRVIRGDVSVLELGDRQTRLVLIEIVRRIKRRKL